MRRSHALDAGLRPIRRRRDTMAPARPSDPIEETTMTDDRSVEARLQRMEDLLEIQRLFFDYGHHLDAGDFDAYASLFAEDGEVKLGPVGRAKGREEIRALMEGMIGASAGQSYHVISGPRVELDGDTATSEVMWTVVSRGADGQAVLSMTGRHRDRLVREDGRWRFQERRGFVDIPSAMPGRDG
jgi:uncharacterized protein (TIGR02246 family)